MRTTIDDELFLKAFEVADPGMDKAEIVREAMRVFTGRQDIVPQRHSWASGVSVRSKAKAICR